MNLKLGAFYGRFTQRSSKNAFSIWEEKTEHQTNHDVQRIGNRKICISGTGKRQRSHQGWQGDKH